MDEEKIMIGMWLTGKHLDDIESVESKDFAMSDIVDCLKDGMNALETSKKVGIHIAEMMKMTTVTSEIFYNMAMVKYQNDKILRDVKEAADAKDIAAVKERIENARKYTSVTADSGIAEEYLKELGIRQNRETVNWSGKLPSLNAMTGGIKRGELTSIAARPSVGKSALGLQIGLYVQGCGRKVLYFPLEMSRVQTCDRIISHYQLATNDQLRSGQLPGDKMAFALDLIDDMERKKNFRFYEGVAEIEKIESAISAEKPFLVIIDQLTQLRSAKRFGSIREKFSYMTSTLKAMAMRHNVAIILLCQVNRSANDIKPTMANLKESGSIEEDSDNVILLHRYPEEQINAVNINLAIEKPMNLNLAKQRAGQTGDFDIIFSPQRFWFYERA